MNHNEKRENIFLFWIKCSRLLLEYQQVDSRHFPRKFCSSRQSVNSEFIVCLSPITGLLLTQRQLSKLTVIPSCFSVSENNGVPQLGLLFSSSPLISKTSRIKNDTTHSTWRARVGTRSFSLLNWTANTILPEPRQLVFILFQGHGSFRKINRNATL